MSPIRSDSVGTKATYLNAIGLILQVFSKLQITFVPEPEPPLLLGAGIGGLAWHSRRG